MKVAYVCSIYPAVSHTFIMTEVLSLRERGVEIGTFSIRQAKPKDILGPVAQDENKTTRYLVPANVFSYLDALRWALTTRPLRFLSVMHESFLRYNMGFTERKSWFYYFTEAVQLAHWIAAGGYEHIHCHFGNAGSNTAYVASRLTGIPFSFTVHGIDMDEPIRFRLPEKIAHCKFMVSISRWGRAKMLLIADAKHWNKIRLVQCGYPGPLDHEVPEPTNQGRMLCVARLSQEKGHIVLFDALKILHDQGRDFVCSLVGEGPMRPVLEKAARDMGLGMKVRFLGAVSSQTVQDLLRQSDLFVMGSLAEGIPIALMEAMANRRPIVAPAVCGIPELIENGKDGLLYWPTSARHLAEALAKILDDPEYARQLGNHAPEAVRRKFRVDVAAERLDALFNGLPLGPRGVIQQ